MRSQIPCLKSYSTGSLLRHTGTDSIGLTQTKVEVGNSKISGYPFTWSQKSPALERWSEHQPYGYCSPTTWKQLALRPPSHLTADPTETLKESCRLQQTLKPSVSVASLPTVKWRVEEPLSLYASHNHQWDHPKKVSFIFLTVCTRRRKRDKNLIPKENQLIFLSFAMLQITGQVTSSPSTESARSCL